MRVIREFFADRAYDAEGRLVPRSVEGSVVADPEAGRRAGPQLLAAGTVITIDGDTVEVEADSDLRARRHARSAVAWPTAGARRSSALALQVRQPAMSRLTVGDDALLVELADDAGRAWRRYRG